MASWDEAEAWYTSIGCELKTLGSICELAHYSLEELEGRPFKPMACRWCSYKAGTRAKWLRDVSNHRNLCEKARHDADLAHSREHLRHYAFEAPTYHLDAMQLSSDILHLVFINIFKTFLEKTIFSRLMAMEAAARAPAEAFLRKHGVPVNLVKAESLDEALGSLTGRDAKVLIADASYLIVELLHFAHAGQDAVQAAMAAGGNDEGFTLAGSDDEDDGGGGSGASSGDADATDRELADAQSWDAFLRYVHELRPFEDDSEAYKEKRAVAAFNAAGPMLREYKRLHPNAQSACCHVALCIVPRQVRARC